MRPDHKLALFYIKFVKGFRLVIITLLTSLLFKPKSHYKKILINRDGAFGDSIVSLPAINLIRLQYPEAQIDLLSINNGGITFNNLGLSENLIDSIFIAEKKERANILRSLKQNGYDLFIQLPQNIGAYKSVRNILLVRFYLKITSAFGWDHGRIKSFMRLQKEYEIIPNETERFLTILKENGIEGDSFYPLKSEPPKDKSIVQLISDQTSIAFLIGGKLQPKKWPLDYWVTLAKLIGQDKKIIIIGGTDEINDGNYIASKTNNTFNLCGKLSIPELLYIFEQIELAISLDTGAMHLCAATEIKLVALFSTRDLSNKWFPNNKNAVVLEKVLPCSFCLKTQCDDNICMKYIKPYEVYAEMTNLI